MSESQISLGKQTSTVGQPLALKKFDLSLLKLDDKISMIAKSETGIKWIKRYNYKK